VGGLVFGWESVGLIPCRSGAVAPARACDYAEDPRGAHARAAGRSLGWW
jgi:hypothetical protein